MENVEWKRIPGFPGYEVKAGARVGHIACAVPLRGREGHQPGRLAGGHDCGDGRWALRGGLHAQGQAGAACRAPELRGSGPGLEGRARLHGLAAQGDGDGRLPGTGGLPDVLQGRYYGTRARVLACGREGKGVDGRAVPGCRGAGREDGCGGQGFRGEAGTGAALASGGDGETAGEGGRENLKGGMA